MTDNNYHRPKFRQKRHRVRNTFIGVAALLIISLVVFIIVGYASSPKTTAPIAQKSVQSKTIDETIDSGSSQNGQSAESSQPTSSSRSESSASSSSHQNASSRQDKQDDSIKESAQLKGKSISEAINWAKAHGRYYSWSITSGGQDAIVTSVHDDGHNISFVASAK